MFRGDMHNQQLQLGRTWHFTKGSHAESIYIARPNLALLREETCSNNVYTLTHTNTHTHTARPHLMLEVVDGEDGACVVVNTNTHTQLGHT